MKKKVEEETTIKQKYKIIYSFSAYVLVCVSCKDDQNLFRIGMQAKAQLSIALWNTRALFSPANTAKRSEKKRNAWTTKHKAHRSTKNTYIYIQFVTIAYLMKMPTDLVSNWYIATDPEESRGTTKYVMSRWGLLFRCPFLHFLHVCLSSMCWQIRHDSMCL